MEVKKCFPPSICKHISKLYTGSSHSAFITNDGKVYTFGLNDDGALGRTSANPSRPGIVELET